MDLELFINSPSGASHDHDSDSENIVTKKNSINKSPVVSDDDEEIFTVTKKRIQTFSDSGNDEEKENKDASDVVNSLNNSDNSSDDSIHISNKKRFRIKKIQNSGSENEDSSEESNKKLYESVRTQNKKKNLKEKFKTLLSKSKDVEKSNNSASNKSDNSDNDEHCLKIKEILKSTVNNMKSLCDPDTSDEERESEEIMTKKKDIKPKKVKPTSPKPQRMSAKEAMENMQKIKSESNRMLREKEVSLPYHRPKALSLKDIMSRRKPAVSSDGKALPIKMNKEQLKQYAMLLEQRQKEVIELCKSDTEEDEASENEEKLRDNILSENKEEEKLNEIPWTDKNKIESTTQLESVVDQPSIEDLKSKDDVSTSNNEMLNYDNSINMSDDVQVEEERMEVDENVINEKLTDNTDVEMDCETEKQEIQHKKNIENNKMCAENDKEKLQQNKVIEASAIVEDESQVMALHYDSEKVNIQDGEIQNIEPDPNKSTEKEINSDDEDSYDNDINFEEIDKFINAHKLTNDTSEHTKENDESLTIHNIVKANPIPKLTGGPGSFINLDDSEPSLPRKLSGVEILKERFSFFANLKSVEDIEKDRDKKYKPGTQHLKLKQELEQQISEQRSLEWEKRLEEEKQLKSEMDQSDDDIEKIEAKLEDEDKIADKSSESEEEVEEPEENDVLLVDKPNKRNPMVDDEAEVSDDEDVNKEPDDEIGKEEYGDNENDEQISDAGEDEDEDSDESSESSESEEETESKPRKGRILKAFEDSDDESGMDKPEVTSNVDINVAVEVSSDRVVQNYDNVKETQDDDLQLAQANKSSEDLFSTQESCINSATLNKNSENNTSGDLGSQTFSILNSVNASHRIVDLDSPSKMSVVCDTQTQSDTNLDHIVGMCSGSFSQNLYNAHSQAPLSQSQEIGDDIAILCTGKFYDNPFVSQIEKNEIPLTVENQSQFCENMAENCTEKLHDNLEAQDEKDTFENNVIENVEVLKEQEEKNYSSETSQTEEVKENTKTSKEQDSKETTILKSIIDELDGPDIGLKQNKYFFNSQPKDKIVENTQKKKFVIDSDEENDNTTSAKKRKKLKKKKAEQRALQFSDDEEEDFENVSDDYESETEQRIVEYDSEENEVEVQPKQPKKKKRMGEFFENEAELTSEDEWVGSGDEDERGLDRMEREEGDDDTFHQGQLQRELGQIHMREVMDQDKREVRLLQELLFEDGDLGDGHRQRKFRWRNAEDGDMETGTNPDEFADTQEDEFESEEQWRKQRHEREMFLRKMQGQDEENLDISINRSTIIKANLNSRSMSSLIAESKCSNSETSSKTENVTSVPEKKTKDIPSPVKPFTIFQQNYHGSLLTRGRGALARLAALATPLATDDNDAPKMIATNNRRNFVFTALGDDEPKVTKRKAEQAHTPRLLKKMKTEQTSKYLKNSLLDHLKS